MVGGVASVLHTRLGLPISAAVSDVVQSDSARIGCCAVARRFSGKDVVLRCAGLVSRHCSVVPVAVRATRIDAGLF